MTIFSKNKTAIIFCVFLGLMGMIVGGTSLVNRYRYLPVEATIIHIEEEYDGTEDGRTYRTSVRYQVDGREYEGEIGYYEPGFKEGKVIEVRYAPDDPTEVEAASLGFSIYAAAVGTALTAYGIYLIFQRKEE